MEPGNPNYDRNRILKWLRECNRNLSSASAYHARLNANSTKFDDRSCSPALPEQMTSYDSPLDSVSEHFSQPAAKSIASFNPSAVAHPTKQLSQEVDLSLQSPTWIKFYNICKRHHPDMSLRFSEKQINHGLLRAIMKKEVSLETIHTMEGPVRLSDTQKQSFHRTFFECLCKNTVPTPVTSGVKRIVNRRCDVTASTAKTSENVLSSKVASSHTRKKPLPPNCSPSSPKTQQAILIKKFKSVQLSSSDSRNYPELRQELNRLGVNQGKIEQIIALKPYDMEASVLNHSLKNVIGLDDRKTHVIARHIKLLSSVDSTINGRKQQISGHQAEK